MATATSQGIAVEYESVETRARFVTRTYNTLFAAILAFAGVEIALFKTGLALPIAQLLTQNWLITLGGFVILGMLGSRMAMRATSPVGQWAALGSYVVLESLIFVPLLVMAEMSAPGAIRSAALVTLLGFAGLTAIAWFSRTDFSFLGGLIKWGGILALVAIVAGVVFGFALGTFFSVLMVGLAGASILYETSNILRHYPEDKHVAAALSLFASVALMFYYVLRLFMSRN